MSVEDSRFRVPGLGVRISGVSQSLRQRGLDCPREGVGWSSVEDLVFLRGQFTHKIVNLFPLFRVIK